VVVVEEVDEVGEVVVGGRRRRPVLFVGLVRRRCGGDGRRVVAGFAGVGGPVLEGFDFARGAWGGEEEAAGCFRGDFVDFDGAVLRSEEASWAGLDGSL